MNATAENSDLVLFDEIAPFVDRVGNPPQFVVMALYDTIKAMLEQEYAGSEPVPVSAICEALGLPVEGVTWDSLVLHLQDLARQAAQAAIGQTPTSPVAALVALSAGEMQSTIQSGISRRNLALAFNLPESASKETILAEIDRRYNLAHPTHEREKELAEKSKLIGLSASFSQRCTNLWGMHRGPTKDLRVRLLNSVCTLAPQQGRAAISAYSSAAFYLNQLSDSQIVSLTVSALARTSRDTRLVMLQASAPGALRAGPARKISDAIC